MSVADTALARAATLTGLAGAVGVQDAAAATSMSQTLATEAAVYNRLAADVAAAEAALTTSQSATSDSLLRLEDFALGSPGGRVRFQADGNMTAETGQRCNAARDAAAAMPDTAYVLAGFEATRVAFNDRVRALRPARDALSQQDALLTGLVDEADQLIDYLQ